jgi:hypothetical protein
MFKRFIWFSVKIDHLDAATARHQSKFLAGEYQLCAGIADDGGDLRGGIVRVEWNGDGAAFQDSEIGRAPVRVVGGEDSATIAGANPLLREPRRPRDAMSCSCGSESIDAIAAR